MHVCLCSTVVPVDYPSAFANTGDVLAVVLWKLHVNGSPHVIYLC
jgi:hypothetical protein